jgi:hypothetical protein
MRSKPPERRIRPSRKTGGFLALRLLFPTVEGVGTTEPILVSFFRREKVVRNLKPLEGLEKSRPIFWPL